MLNRMDMLRIFCVAAQASSFREAASRLGISPQGVTRAVKALEQELGEVLFHRSTRQIHITAFGEQLARDAARTLERFEQLFRQAGSNADHGLAGRVGITAPHAVGRLFLLRFLQPLLAEHPDLQVELRLDDQVTDSVDAQIDIGLRVGLIRDRRYIARAVAPVPLHVVASPTLLQRDAAPQTLDELAHWPLSVLIDRRSGRPWPWMFRDGVVWQPERAAFTCDDPEAERDAVLAGLAIGQLPSYLALPAIERGELVRLLPELAPPPWELFIYRPQRGPVAPRVRLVYDHLIACFSDPARFPQ
ncbi:LysR family transcriptional regulator [Pseudomonas sp. 21C1]|nr:MULTISPECIES: LysR family transcriptional regulator [Pseudomonas]OEC33775.1 LysR family transcriptional regulator [Pseudomonas sp. 21C1]